MLQINVSHTNKEDTVKPWITSLFFCLLAMTLIEGCGNSRGYNGAAGIIAGSFSPSPITVREAFSSTTFTNGTRFLAMKLYITNTSGRAITLDKLDCVFETLAYQTVSSGQVVADFEMEFGGRKYTFPSQVEVNGPSFGLFFISEVLTAGETLIVEVYATINGCSAGKNVVFGEQAIGVRSYDNETHYRSVWMKCLQ